MIRSAASLARRVAGMPGRLVLGLAALAMLVAAALCGATPSEARPAGPACAVASVPAVAAVLAAAPDAQARRAGADRAGLERPGLCAIDFESGPADLGLARVPTDALRRARAPAAFRSGPDEILASAPGGSPLRPPRVA